MEIRGVDSIGTYGLLDTELIGEGGCRKSRGGGGLLGRGEGGSGGKEGGKDGELHGNC